MRIDHAFPIPIVTLDLDKSALDDVHKKVCTYVKEKMPESKQEKNKLLTTYYHDKKREQELKDDLDALDNFMK